jgi:RHS repeat-associated protein
LSASTDSQGNVTISDDGAMLILTKNADGSYTPAPGEFGTLSLESGAYQLVRTDKTILAFNPDGSLNYLQDTNGNRVTAGYNSSGDLTSLLASNGSALTLTYNSQGLITSITDPSRQATQYIYDASGQHLLSYADVFGTTTYTYATGPTAADANSLATLTFADGTGLAWSYDAQGRLASESRLGGEEALTFAYPAPGEYTITDANGNATAYFRDAQGNLSETVDALGNITRYVYDQSRDVIRIIAADGTTTTMAYDSSGNMTSETDPLGYTIQYTYNQFSEPLSLVNQQGFTTTFQYDPQGNLLELTNPDGTTEQYACNALGELTSSTDADGHTVTCAYNPSGQLTTENRTGGASDTYTFGSHGNMLTASGPGGDWSFTYNSQNLPTSIIEPNGTLLVQYGIDGNITQIKDQTGFTTNYAYDSVGRLSELTDGNDNLIASYSYDPAGNVIGAIKGNGTSTTYQYDADNHVTQLTNLAPGGSSANSAFTYAYNSLGQITSQTSGGATTSFGYDADGELISVSGPGESIQYTYDPAGNRTSVTENGVVTNYVSNSVNEYTSTTTNGVMTSYEYDANGNLIGATTGGQTTSYSYNALNQLTGVNGPNGSFSYVYDPLGNQVSATANGQTTNNLIYAFNLRTVAAQFSSSGALLAHFTYGFGIVSQVTAAGTPYYYDYNLQGSTVGITSSAGAYVNRYSYDPFGQVNTSTAVISNPFTFVGQAGVSSDASRLSLMRTRYYDPSTGQFVSDNPAAFLGGDINERDYAGNSPVDHADPLGLGYTRVALVSPSGHIDGFSAVRAASNGARSVPKDDPTNAVIFLVAVPVALVVAVFWKAVHLFDPPGHFFAPPPPPIPPELPENPEPEPITWENEPDYQPGYPETYYTFNSDTFSSSDDGFTSDFIEDLNLDSALVDFEAHNQVPADPNDLLGPSGFGPAGFLTAAGTLGYTIEFSNEKNAPAPADNVVVTEQLSPNLNWSTFQLGTIGFGNVVVNVPAGLTSYTTRVDATATLGVYVDLSASLNRATGLLTVTFRSLDPATLDTPANPLVGFLPPDTSPPSGEGYIDYTIQPRPALATGTVLDAQASIVFDTNAAIATPQVTNTVDSSAPSSSVTALPATTTSPSFTVSWSGSDGAGSGIARYNVFVSDNGGAYTLWQSATTATSATYNGQVDHTYAFYSVATDNVGLVQPTPASAQATTEVLPPPPPLVTVMKVVDKLNKQHQVTEVDVIFSGAINSTQADATTTYRLATPGKKNSYTAKNAQVIKLKQALYTAATKTVALTPKRPFVLTKPVQVLIYGTGPTALQDAEARLIDGDHNGSPGGNAIAVVAKNRVTLNAIKATGPQAVTLRERTASIDAVLARGEIRVRRARPVS